MTAVLVLPLSSLCELGQVVSPLGASEPSLSIRPLRPLHSTALEFFIGSRLPFKRSELAWAQSVTTLSSPLWPDIWIWEGVPGFCRLVSR